MINPAAAMKLMGAKNKFSQAHPKFVAFIKSIIQQGVEEGCVIEVTVTKPDGTSTTGNMKVQQIDLEVFEDLKGVVN